VRLMPWIVAALADPELVLLPTAGQPVRRPHWFAAQPPATVVAVKMQVEGVQGQVAPDVAPPARVAA